MFTGIVEELGRVRAVQEHAGGARLEIEAGTVLEDARVGDSIAVNGCCLTVVERRDSWFAADAVIETLERTNLGALAPNDAVNLERSVRLSDRLGGHIVQGHVDGVGTIVSREPLADGSTRITFAAPPDVLRYIVEKGSITLDGVSMTVTGTGEAVFSVAAIPHTLSVTTLGGKDEGMTVNVEVDIVAKYVERLVSRETRA